ncbi:MAG: glycine cleavage system protein GcvH [Limnochordia bacterium]|jgi:glycine cleavage system H protein|nr:glycine cleavage system protein GcvH [Bacillota bacterium]HOB08318.1 glycine cleavage system protein GcvH [Limnochordia bacterium]NLH30928.1 glycine cleavage system protein GcvH [Bacillota bacterium]HPT92604.1 glycine cleavage system protein GcvH [Limnochordia bacterium]HPZ30560.1 glycine cleavage system protein GcvH [Limnochordia bacterium]
MEVRKGLLYSKEHEWVQEISDSVVRVGITEYAQDQLGDIVYIELPEIDAEVAKGESFTVVESVKAASDVYAPVSGTVVAVNEKLEDNPELINESPYDEGWIVEIKCDELDLSDLMTAEEYARYIEEV